MGVIEMPFKQIDGLMHLSAVHAMKGSFCLDVLCNILIGVVIIRIFLDEQSSTLLLNGLLFIIVWYSLVCISSVDTNSSCDLI